MADEVAWLVNALKADKTSEEVILAQEPRALPLEGLVVDVPLLHPDLAVTVANVSAWPRDGLEADAACAPEAGADELEHLGLSHEITLDPLVNGPVVAGPVLGRHPDYHVPWNYEPSVQC